MIINMGKFKKGDTVTDDDYGDGYVLSDKSGIITYPIEVVFESEPSSSVLYTVDGRSPAGSEPTLKKSDHGWKG